MEKSYYVGYEAHRRPAYEGGEPKKITNGYLIDAEDLIDLFERVIPELRDKAQMDVIDVMGIVDRKSENAVSLKNVILRTEDGHERLTRDIIAHLPEAQESYKRRIEAESRRVEKVEAEAAKLRGHTGKWRVQANGPYRNKVEPLFFDTEEEARKRADFIPTNGLVMCVHDHGTYKCIPVDTVRGSYWKVKSEEELIKEGYDYDGYGIVRCKECKSWMRGKKEYPGPDDEDFYTVGTLNEEWVCPECGHRVIKYHLT